jgi:hypothetical protein
MALPKQVMILLSHPCLSLYTILPLQIPIRGPVVQYYTSVCDRPATWLVRDPIDATIIWCEKQYSSIAWPHRPHRVPGISCMSDPLSPRSAMVAHWHLYYFIFKHSIYIYISIVYMHLLFEYMPSSFRVWTISSSLAASTDIDCFYTGSLCAVLVLLEGWMKMVDLLLDLIKWYGCT